MSFSLSVYLRREALPSLAAWQAQLDGAGFALQLSAQDLLAHQGFWPAHWQGEASGFEWRIAPPAVDEEDVAPEADTVAVLSGKGREEALISAAAATLALCAGGRVVDHQEGDMAEGEALLPWARGAIERASAPPLPLPQLRPRGARPAWALLGLTLALLVWALLLPRQGDSAIGTAWVFGAAALLVLAQGLLLMPLRLLLWWRDRQRQMHGPLRGIWLPPLLALGSFLAAAVLFTALGG